MNDYPIEISDLEMRYGRKGTHALKGVSLVVERGDVFGYLGPNGAGKTTTLKILMGLIQQTSGSAKIFGKDSADCEARGRVGFLPEDPNFYEYLTARETLKFFAGLFGIRGNRAEDRIDWCLERVGLVYAAGTRAGDFSRGMRQRLGLAQAMISDPDVLLLDEPLSGLDPVGRAQIRNVILEQSGAGKTVLFSSHILPDVEAICSRVGIIADGRLTASGTIDDMLSECVESIELVMAALPAGVLSVVEKLADSVRTVRDKNIVGTSSMRTAQEIMKLVISGGGTVENVTPNRETLEDIFMRRIGEKT